jgi:Flp pilus assembly protein TadD
MVASRNDAWGRVRQSFLDQFEAVGTDFLYRRSQKGEAYRVSSADRDRFAEQFDRHLGRAKWIIGIGLALVMGVVVSLSMLQHIDPSQVAVFAGVGLVMIPYLAYFRWAWAEPARELADRVPVAGERSPEEVQRLKFQRLTYRQLAGAAFVGIVAPFAASSRQDIFSGWNRLWLVFGGALVLLAAVQAFRKWQFEQADPLEGITPPPTVQDIAEPSQNPGWRTNGQLVRYLLIGVALLAVAFIVLTPAGKRIVQLPGFLPTLMFGFGCWALFTVARGFAKGRIEPFARGFYNTYVRETQPKRFWVSMGWNTLLGGLFVWFGLTTLEEAPAQAIERRCYDFEKTTPQDQLAACNQLVEKHDTTGTSLAGLKNARGSAFYRLGNYSHAMTDYTDAMRLDPSDSSARYNRGLVDEQLGDRSRAVIDYGDAIRAQADNADAYFKRGLIFLDTGRFDQAVADFTRVHELRPKDPWALADRGIGYAWKRDSQRAEQDFAVVRASDPSNPVLLRGEALLAMNAGDMATAIDRLTAALKLDPNDAWSLGMRARAYRQLGNYEKSQTDEIKLEQLSKRRM